MSRPRRPRALVAALTLCLALAACTSGQGSGTTDVATCPDGTTATAPSGPDALPATTLSVLGQESQVATACWVGQPLVVNFWAEWCGPCKDEMPDFEAVHQAVGDQVRFIGVDYQDRPQAALAFAEQVGVTYELVEDPDGSFFRAVEGRGTPQTLLVDADGRIVYRHAGPLTRSALEQLLADELDVRA